MPFILFIFSKKKFKRSNVVETCKAKGIPVIQRHDVTVVKSMIWGPYVGYVCEAQWTKPDGIKVCFFSIVYSCILLK